MGSSLSVWSVLRCCLSLAMPDYSHLATELGEVWFLVVFGVSSLDPLSVTDLSLLGSSLTMRSSPDLERPLVCQALRWPLGASRVQECRWRFSTLRLSVLLCPCEVHHVWGCRFLWRKKCFLARVLFGNMQNCAAVKNPEAI